MERRNRGGGGLLWATFLDERARELKEHSDERLCEKARRKRVYYTIQPNNAPSSLSLSFSFPLSLAVHGPLYSEQQYSEIFKPCGWYNDG